jgi:hypothetical protein
MRKSLAGVAAIAAIFLLPTMAAAATPIENLSPASGTTLTVSAGGVVRVEYTCPSFYTSYDGVQNYENYWAEFASSPTLNAENQFPEYNQIDLERAVPTVGNPERCESSFPEEQAVPGATIYWRATRINCDVLSCTEAGPTWTFAVVTPAPVVPTPIPTPTPTAPAAPQKPTTSTGDEGKVTVWVGCGTNSRTSPSAACGKNQPIGAFFKDSKEATYTVCVRYPGVTKSCAHKQRAEAGVVYVNTVKRHSAGRYTLTWTVGARRFEKHVARRAT